MPRVFKNLPKANYRNPYVTLLNNVVRRMKNCLQKDLQPKNLPVSDIAKYKAICKELDLIAKSRRFRDREDYYLRSAEIEGVLIQCLEKFGTSNAEIQRWLPHWIKTIKDPYLGLRPDKS